MIVETSPEKIQKGMEIYDELSPRCRELVGELGPDIMGFYEGWLRNHRQFHPRFDTWFERVLERALRERNDRR